MGRFHTRRALLAMLLALLLTHTSPARASATFVVASQADAADADIGDAVCADATGMCTLRAAVQQAGALAGPSVVVLPKGTYTLEIPAFGEEQDPAVGDLDIAGDLTIAGGGSGQTVIDGNGAVTSSRVFELLAGSSASISGVTVRNGRAPAVSGVRGAGGAILSAGALRLTDVIVAGNIGGRPGGGGVASLGGGRLWLLRASLIGNTADFGGGFYGAGPNSAAIVEASAILSNTATYAGGGLFSGGVLTATNTTISGNIAIDDLGGGIYNDTNAALALLNVTISGNVAIDAGGGLFSAESGRAWLKNTIVAANTPDAEDCAGPIASGGHNLSGGASCGLNKAGDLIDTDPQIGALGNNGGPTPTHALLAGSLAIDAGDLTGCPTTDQRAMRRPSGASCDIGAYELQVLGATVFLPIIARS